MKTFPVSPEQIQQVHQLYCQLTGQTLSLGFDRERMWYELLQFGYGLEHIKKVIRYLQREIREGRRNVGSLKLSNFLQPDRFEEDLNIAQVLLRPPPPPSPPSLLTHSPTLDPKTRQEGVRKAVENLRKLKAQLSGIKPPI